MLIKHSKKLLCLAALTACGQSKDNPALGEGPSKTALEAYALMQGYWAGQKKSMEQSLEYPEYNPQRCVQDFYDIQQDFVGLDVSIHYNTDCEALATRDTDFLLSALFLNDLVLTALENGYTQVTGNCSETVSLCPKAPYTLAFKLLEDGLSIARQLDGESSELNFANPELFSRLERPY